MSYRNHGIPRTFALSQTSVSEKKIGQLVAISGDNEVSTVVEQNASLVFPLISDIQNGDLSADVTTHGNGKFYVEDASGIVAGSKLGIGDNGIGVALHTSGLVIGFALEAPKGDGDHIAGLISFSNNANGY